MKIARNFYLEKLINRRHNGLVKVITEICRCGKSQLMNTIFYRYLTEQGVPEDHIIRFAFDSAEDLHKINVDLTNLIKGNRKADPDKFIDYIHSLMTDQQMYYLLLDEIQELDCFEAVLNGYLCMENVDVGIVPLAERKADGKISHKQAEVDFVCNLGSRRYYIQSAFSIPDEAKRAQEIRPLEKIDDSFKKIVITGDIIPASYDDHGILTMGICDFLLDPKALDL